MESKAKLEVISQFGSHVIAISPLSHRESPRTGRKYFTRQVIKLEVDRVMERSRLDQDKKILEK